MDTSADHFRSLHRQPQILRLANAWDVASAKLIESLGATAVATTSAGVAWSMGYADGSKTPTNMIIALAENLVRVLKVPLSIDIEDGLSDSPLKVADFVLRLADAGVAGINIEDGRKPIELLERKISAIRSHLSRQKLDLFINARTDVYLARLTSEPDLLSEVMQREKRYVEVGADGIFVPGLAKEVEIAAMVNGASVPLNLMAWGGLPDAGRLEKLGVRRLSAGASLALAIWGQAKRNAGDFLETGESDRLVGQLPYSAMQALFS